MPDSASSLPFEPSTPIPPPLLGAYAVYVSGEDALRCLVYNAAAGVIVRAKGRFLPLGSSRVSIFALDVPAPSDRTLGSRSQALGEGWLLDVTVTVVAGTPLLGQTWAQVILQRGLSSVAEALLTLTSGYVTAVQRIAWPTGIPTLPLDGPGALRSYTGSTPAAAGNISETVPTGARWQIVAGRFSLVTSATVANRLASVECDDGSLAYLTVSPRSLQTASQTWIYSLGTGFVFDISAGDNKATIPLPAALQLAGGHRFKTVALGLQAADQFSAPQLLLREWIDV